MSDKTFLQELDLIKRKLESVQSSYLNGDEEINIENGLNEAIHQIQTMINQCIEIQLAVMKQSRNEPTFCKQDK